MEPVLKLMEKKEWSVEIDGFDCEIIFWSTEIHRDPKYSDIYPHKGIWNSYIRISEGQLGEDFKRVIPKVMKVDWGCGEMFDYSKVPVSMENGSLTFFEVHRTPKGKIDGVKFGNDYNHIWNEHEYINEKTIYRDLQKAVESLKMTFPNYKVRSTWDGKYIKLGDRAAHDENKRQEYFDKQKTKEVLPIPSQDTIN